MVRGGQADVTQYWGKPRLPKRRRRIFLVADFRGTVPEKYFLKKGQCSRILRLAQIAECPPPKPVEYILKKARRNMPIVRPFQERPMRSKGECDFFERP